MDVTTGNEKLHGEQKNLPASIIFLAHFFSFLFHPIFIPVYVVCFLLFAHPVIFSGYSYIQKLKVLAPIVVNLTFFPAITVFLLWRLKFVSSMFLRTQKERIIPYAVAMIFYFWAWYVFRNLPEIPIILRQFLLGSFLIVIAAWLANIYFKISMHALAVGGMTVFMIYVSLVVEGGSGLYLTAALLIAGIVCSSRLIVSNHHPSEVYSGFILAGLCQLLAIWL